MCQDEKRLLKSFEEKMYGDVWDKEKYLSWMYENLMAIKSVMSESISVLKSAIEEAKRTLVNAMIKVVMEHGEDFHDSYDYYFNDFGIDEEETEENTKVLKIIDMFNNGGCCFPHAYMYHQILPTEDKESKIEWCSLAYWGLYVVKEKKQI